MIAINWCVYYVINFVDFSKKTTCGRNHKDTSFLIISITPVILKFSYNYTLFPWATYTNNYFSTIIDIDDLFISIDMRYFVLHKYYSNNSLFIFNYLDFHVKCNTNSFFNTLNSYYAVFLLQYIASNPCLITITIFYFMKF